MSSGSRGCPHCGNTLGFAFGTCCECGYNSLDKEFKHIKVYQGELPDYTYRALAQDHAERTRKK